MKNTMMRSLAFIACAVCVSGLVFVPTVASAGPAGGTPDATSTVNVVVQPTSAPHQKKRRRATLPGVGHYMVNERLTRGSVVRTNGDGTEIVLISSKFPNRIATPFDHPRVIDQSHVDYRIDGSNIYLVAKNNDPAAIFVTGGGRNDPVVSLTLMPKDIPSQVITLQVDIGQSSTRKVAKNSSYEDKLLALMRTVTLGKIPEGFSEGMMPTIVAKHNEAGLTITPVVRYSGSSLDIYKYKVEDDQATVELSETSFYQKGVRAVSVFPNVVLHKGEFTYVFVIADKSVLEDGQNDR